MLKEPEILLHWWCIFLSSLKKNYVSNTIQEMLRFVFFFYKVDHGNSKIGQNHLECESLD